ncbi:MAG TPA: helix-turn-helix domain-containing protein [Solirubrobacteraceae bacterium]|nr:helix-turn-helix domain-containing protein [Solirubrobacteraceae bacterium]
MASELPPALAAALRPTLPDLAQEIIAAIGRDVPDYARPLEGPFGRALRVGVERALARFVDGIEDPSAGDGGAREIYVALGRGEMRAGRSLDALLSAYRIGARLAWERFVAAGEAAGHEPRTLYRLASAIFDYIDGISAESVEGFTQERAAAEGERQRRRRALARLLTREDVALDEVRDLARVAGWSRPATVAALVVGDATGEEPDADRVASRLGAGTIAVAEGSLTIAWVPDPEAPGRRTQLEAALDDGPAALGPAVPLERAPLSLARARAAHALAAEHRVDGGALVVADEHLSALLLHGGDAALAADLAASALAPLADLRAGARTRLRATLRAWLDHPGQVTLVAGELHVHPQTVRYRVAQLRELFGERLDDPEARFELALALRAEPG